MAYFDYSCNDEINVQHVMFKLKNNDIIIFLLYKYLILFIFKE